MTKHRPRTPLPWPPKCSYDVARIPRQYDGSSLSAIPWIDPADESFAVQASNAYPRLISAINNWLQNGFFPDGARQLLKEVGE